MHSQLLDFGRAEKGIDCSASFLFAYNLLVLILIIVRESIYLIVQKSRVTRKIMTSRRKRALSTMYALLPC